MLKIKVSQSYEDDTSNKVVLKKLNIFEDNEEEIKDVLHTHVELYQPELKQTIE